MRNLVILLSILCFIHPTFASQYEYPELLVTPRATERLHQESTQEAQRRWTTHLPIQVSALTTLTAGILQFGNVDDENDKVQKFSPVFGVATGLGWLATTFLMSRSYTPYSDGYEKIKEMPHQTKRQTLAKERYAEEAINDARTVGSRLMWLSVATNLLASGYMISSAESDSISIPAGALAAVASFAPVIFKYHWQKVAREHQKYKKRIYAPIAMSTSALYEPGSKKIAPGVVFGLTF